MNEKLNKIRRVQQQLSQSLGRTPVVAEIAESLNVLPNQIREYLHVSRTPVSLEMRVGDERETELADILPMDGISLDEQIALEFLHQDLDLYSTTEVFYLTCDFRLATCFYPCFNQMVYEYIAI
ncbi:MAG: sigma-70 domain-containing protein [Nostoc sp.]